MFGRDKNDEKKRAKLMKNVDKLIMGAIIGGAIGSVIGAKYQRGNGGGKPSMIKRIFRKLFNGKKEEK